MLDDWGDMLGLKGCGLAQHPLRAQPYPRELGLRGQHDRRRRHRRDAGLELHGNPMYAGRALCVFTMSLAAVTVGAAYNALDEYERLMRTKTTPLPPFAPRIHDRNYQDWYGRALTHIATAEAALRDTAERHMELCRRSVEEGPAYSYGDDMLLAGIAREVMITCWEIVDDDLWQTVGASVARDGERMARVFRDMAVAVAHRNRAAARHDATARSPARRSASRASPSVRRSRVAPRRLRPPADHEVPWTSRRS